MKRILDMSHMRAQLVDHAVGWTLAGLALAKVCRQ